MQLSFEGIPGPARLRSGKYYDKQNKAAYDKRRRELYPERVAEQQKRSYKKHWKARAQSANERYRRSAVGGMLYRAEYRARKNGWEFNLTIDDISIPDVCPMLGIPMWVRGISFDDRKGRLHDGSPTLDRIDNRFGYVKGNVRVVSWRANRLKSDATLAEIEAISAYMRAAFNG